MVIDLYTSFSRPTKCKELSQRKVKRPADIEPRGRSGLELARVATEALTKRGPIGVARSEWSFTADNPRLYVFLMVIVRYPTPLCILSTPCQTCKLR